MLVAARHDKRKIDFVRKKLRQTVREETACKEKFDFRVAGAEPINGARQDLGRQGRRDRNAQLLEFSRSRCRDGCGCLIGICGNCFGVRKKTASGSIEPQSQGRSLKERTAELLFELTHRFGNGRLREAEFISGAAHAARTNNGEKGFDLANFHGDADLARASAACGRSRSKRCGSCIANELLRDFSMSGKQKFGNRRQAARGSSTRCRSRVREKDAGPSCRLQPCRKDLPFRDAPRSNAGLRVRRSR